MSMHWMQEEALERERRQREYEEAEYQREAAEAAEALEIRQCEREDAEWLVREFGAHAMDLAADYQVLAADVAEALAWIEIRRAA